MNNNAAHDDSNKSTDVTLRDVVLKLLEWWRYLLSKWVIICIAAFVGASIGLVYALTTKIVYKAELSFALEDERSSGLNSALGIASQFGLDLGNGSSGVFAGDNLIALMKSRTMIQNTLLSTVEFKNQKQTLAEVFITVNKIREGWKDDPELSKVKFSAGLNPSKLTTKQDSILGVFCRDIVSNNLQVDKFDKRLSIILVRVTSVNELFSKAFCESLVETVSNFYIATKTKKSVENVRVLQSQTDSVRRALNAAITGVASFTDNNPNPNPALQILRAPSQKRQVDVQTNQAILTQLVTNLEVSKVVLRKETPLIQVIDKPILPLDKKRASRSISILVGGILAGVITALFILIKSFFKNLLNK